MLYANNETGAVQLTLTAHEAQRLEDFLHVAAMAQMTWPLCVDEYMTRRKKHHDHERRMAADPGVA
jgi:hypothetical protein